MTGRSVDTCDSLNFYKYLCQRIGSEEDVRIRRLAFVIRDIGRNDTSITSGSKGEGLNLNGSDLDLMIVDRCAQVYESEEEVVTEGRGLPFMMYTEDTPPCFTQLYLLTYHQNQTISSLSVLLFKMLDTNHLGYALSSELYKLFYLSNAYRPSKIHGPCISDEFDQQDVAFCLKCDTWICQAKPWFCGVMATPSLRCGVCDLRQVNKSPIVWCTECDEGLCIECQEHHSLSKGTSNHRVIPVTEYEKLPAYVLKISQYCSKHNKKYQIYCRKHESPCCSQCTVETHNECRDIVELHDIIQKTKASNALCEIEKTVNEVAENLKKIRQSHEENLSAFKARKTEIENEIKNTRIKINAHLDKLQEDFIKQLNVVEEKENSKICQLLTSLEKMEKEISDYQGNIATIKQHATDLQMFLSLRQIEEDVDSKDKLLQSIAEGSEQHIISYSIQDIMSEIKYFGKVHMEAKAMDIVLTRRKSKQAQMMVPTVQIRPFESIKLKIHKIINSQALQIRGCCILPNQRIAYTCFQKCTITVCNKGGVNYFTVKMPNTPYDIISLGEDNTLAVTSDCSQRQCLTIIDLERKQIKKTIPLYSSNYGIASKERNLIYSAKDKGIRMVNPFDESISDIIRDEMPSDCYIATFKDKIFHTNRETDTVTCYNVHGLIHWKFLNRSVLTNPLGIDVDGDGNVYVVGYSSNNLVVISPAGQRYKEILTASDGLKNPTSLHYSRPRNQLLVANMSSKIFLFNFD